MKSNRVMWGMVALIVLMTLAVSFGTINSHSQQDGSKKQDKSGFDDLSKYAVVKYDAPESKDATEREQRKLKNQRYDDQHWVVKSPHPETSGVGRIDDTPPPPMIPVAESDLIIIGQIADAKAHLSNDKRGIYTEFVIRIDEILKSDSSFAELARGDSITADRAGGFIQYPNGQRVLYKLSDYDLPRVGDNYVLFLRNGKGKGSNYEILTGHELKNDIFVPLDTNRRSDDFKENNKLNFIRAIRNKIADSSGQ